MSRVRGVEPERIARWTKGRCRWCDGAVEAPRRTFCSDACVEQWMIRSRPQYARKRVFERDKGVCRECGRDCRELEARLLHLLYSDPSKLDVELARLGLTRLAYQVEALDRRVPVHLKGRMGRPVDATKIVWDPTRSLWEADHVVAVVDGGGSAGLDNLATLCRWCHRQKTAQLARRRAIERAQPPADFFPAPKPPPPDLFD